MSFLAEETSVEGGAPIELFEFTLAAEIFCYTTGEDEITVGGMIYKPIYIERSEIQVGPDERTQIIQVSMPADNEFATKYTDIVPGAPANLTIKRVHRFDGANQTAVRFKGVVRSVAYTSQGTRAQLAVLPLSAGMSRQMPRFLYSGLCNHVLYDSRCAVPQDDFRFSGTITVINGNDITVPGVGASVASPGDSGFVSAGNADYRLVLRQVGDVLTLLLPFDTNVADVGTTVDVFAGCDHTISTCFSQFDNIVNYGGFAFVPLKNIFQTGLD